MIQQIRKIIRNKVLDVLSLRSEPNAGIHILNGHFLSRDQERPAEVFRELITNLRSFGIQMIDFSEAVKRIDTGEYPEGICYVAFTFDDGLISNLSETS